MKFDATKAPKEKHVLVSRDFDVDFAKVPFGLAEYRRVSGNAVKLYIIYFSYTFNWRGTSPKRMRRVCQDEIAKRLGYSITTVSNLTRELHDSGYITVKRTGRSNIIILHGRPKRHRNVHKKQA